MWCDPGSSLPDEQTVRSLVRMGTWTVEQVYVKDSEFSLGFIEHLLNAKNYSRYFTCITSFYLHKSPFGDGTPNPGCLAPVSVFLAADVI